MLPREAAHHGRSRVRAREALTSGFAPDEGLTAGVVAGCEAPRRTEQRERERARQVLTAQVRAAPSPHRREQPPVRRVGKMNASSVRDGAPRRSSAHQNEGDSLAGWPVSNKSVQTRAWGGPSDASLDSGLRFPLFEQLAYTAGFVARPD